MHRAWARWLSVAVCFVLLGLFAPVSAGASTGQASLGDVVKALKIDAVPVDYVVIVDTSGSMQGSGLYPKVKTALGSFLKALKPTDHLSLLTFDTTATLRYTGAVGTNPTAALNQLPPTANGQATDIGAGIDAGLAELERPGANSVGAVVLMTDGLLNAPPGSAYPTATAPGWNGLHARAQKVLASHKIASYGLALEPTTDAALLKKVFPGTLVVDIPSGQIGSYLNRVSDELTRQKAIQALQPDLANGLQATWSGPLTNLELAKGTANAQLAVRSSYMKIPVTVTDPAAATSGVLKATVSGLPTKINLAPGQSRSYPVHLKFPTVGGFGFGKHTVKRVGTVALSGHVSSPWQQVITTNLGLAFSPKFTTAAATLTGTGATGWSWLTLSYLPLALVLLVLVLWLIRRSRMPRLVGTLEVWHAGERAAEFPVGGKALKLGKGARSVPGQPLSGSVRGLRRRNEYDRSTESGVNVDAKSGPAHAHGRLFDGDSLDVGDIRITYNR